MELKESDLEKGVSPEESRMSIGIKMLRRKALGLPGFSAHGTKPDQIINSQGSGAIKEGLIHRKGTDWYGNLESMGAKLPAGWGGFYESLPVIIVTDIENVANILLGEEIPQSIREKEPQAKSYLAPDKIRWILADNTQTKNQILSRIKNTDLKEFSSRVYSLEEFANLFDENGLLPDESLPTDPENFGNGLSIADIAEAQRHFELNDERAAKSKALLEHAAQNPNNPEKIRNTATQFLQRLEEQEQWEKGPEALIERANLQLVSMKALGRFSYVDAASIWAQLATLDPKNLTPQQQEKLDTVKQRYKEVAKERDWVFPESTEQTPS